jgi:hypothetical protein
MSLPSILEHGTFDGSAIEGDAMYSMDIKVGRLVELRIESPFAMTDFGPFRERLGKLLQSAPGKVVACTDLRRANVFAKDVADTWITIMRGDNPKMERSAFLVTAGGLFGGQIERMINEAGSPIRKVFRESLDLKVWLGTALTADEKTRVTQFLNEISPSAPSKA